MKAFKLIKLFTLVGFFVASVHTFAGEAEDNETKEACRARIAKEKKSEITATCNGRTTTTTNSAGKQSDEPLTFSQKEACVKSETELEMNTQCGDKETQKDKNQSCKSALKDYDDALKKTDEECNRMDVGSVTECRTKARQCAKGLDSFGSEEPESESATASIVRMIGVYGQMQRGATGGNASGCVLENDDKAAEKEEQIDDKITRVREEIQDLKEKATAVDKELSEKKQDVEKEMLDVEKDAEKAKFERQTKNQEDVGRMQKAIMASEKKRRDNILKIADLNVDIANFSFAHQKLNLALSDGRITKDCRDKSIATMNAKVKGVIDPKSGKEIRPKFTQQESLQFKKDLKMEEANCLQEKALQRQETTKALIDAKRKVKVQVDTLTTANVDEEKAIASEIKQMEALKTIAAEEEKVSIESKLKKLNSLNKSVTDMEKYVIDKKKSYDAKSKAKEDQINKLLMDRQNVKPKFAKISSIVDASGRLASVYINQCCSFADKTKNHSDCTRVTSSEPDAKTRKSIPATKK